MANENTIMYRINISNHRADTVCNRIGQHGHRVDYGEVGEVI